MADIIERLRDIRRGQVLEDGSYQSVADLCREAADEIERLRALNATLQEMNDNQRKMIERLDDDRRKLEAELWEVGVG